MIILWFSEEKKDAIDDVNFSDVGLTTRLPNDGMLGGRIDKGETKNTGDRPISHKADEYS